MRLPIAPLCLALALTCSTHGQSDADPGRRFSRLLAGVAPQPMDEAPAWAASEQLPLFRFAWLSDLHLDASCLAVTERALRTIDQRLRPDFVLFTGDNNALAEPVDARDALPLGERRQRYFAAFLRRNVSIPTVVLPGDNWPQGFEKVFGARQFSFDFGGIHFLMVSTDRRYRSNKAEVLAGFSESAWQWITGDLQANRRRPTVLVLHEPIVPPTFLDAGRLRRLLADYPNVFVALHGHLHADLQLTDDRRAYLVCPSLGRTARSPWKLVHVYPQRIVLRTYHLDDQRQQFVPAPIWQKIDVPESLQAELRVPRTTFSSVRRSTAPLEPHREDDALASRSLELAPQMRRFLMNDLPRVLRRAAADGGSPE